MFQESCLPSPPKLPKLPPRFTENPRPAHRCSGQYASESAFVLPHTFLGRISRHCHLALSLIVPTLSLSRNHR
ncbi:hypothetical protein L1987_34745 [Smallanthus sonchifolius]|uniref:Uncharacterized protein n=1 Tax=Smallanthus sonchifolius TaxID=185202 RepID=A0ACB9HUD5_9ASTR|nr:hypothetical protein L1987_34745 [Smallanthus sonchifolius]